MNGRQGSHRLPTLITERFPMEACHLLVGEPRGIKNVLRLAA